MGAIDKKLSLLSGTSSLDYEEPHYPQAYVSPFEEEEEEEENN